MNVVVREEEIRKAVVGDLLGVVLDGRLDLDGSTPFPNDDECFAIQGVSFEALIV